MIICIPNTLAAKLTGKATYHHLQKSAVILYFFNQYKDWQNPHITKNISLILHKIDDTVRYLLNFPANTDTKRTLSIFFAAFDSWESFSPNQKNSPCWAKFFSSAYSKSETIGWTCPPVPHQVNALCCFVLDIIHDSNIRNVWYFFYCATCFPQWWSILGSNQWPLQCQCNALANWANRPWTRNGMT